MTRRATKCPLYSGVILENTFFAWWCFWFRKQHWLLSCLLLKLPLRCHQCVWWTCSERCQIWKEARKSIQYLKHYVRGISKQFGAVLGNLISHKISDSSESNRFFSGVLKTQCHFPKFQRNHTSSGFTLGNPRMWRIRIVSWKLLKPFYWLLLLQFPPEDYFLRAKMFLMWKQRWKLMK